MTLDEAIRHCKDVAESKRKQVENGDWEKGSPTERDCIECAAEHRQLAEWLKELKAYKEQSGDAISRQAVLYGLASIAKAKARSDAQKSLMGRVMFFTERLPSVTPQPCEDAVSRQAVAQVLLKYAHSTEGKAFAEFLISQINNLPSVTPQHSDAEIQKIQEMEQAEIQKAYELGKAEMQSSEDAISREAAIEAIEALQRPIMREESNYYQFKFSGMSEAREAVVNLPSVSSQQRTGRWISDVIQGEIDGQIVKGFTCSKCGAISVFRITGGKVVNGDLCPNCGAKMEVEDAD